MRLNNKSKSIIIIMLMVSTIGLTIGFAAYSKNLIIKSKINVEPLVSANLVRLSSSSSDYATNPVTYSVEGDGVTAKNATIDNEQALGPTLRNISVTFNNKSHYQTVTYTFYIRNDGANDVYLTDVLFLNNSSFVFKSCSPKSGGSQSDADMFCKGINISLTIGNVTIKSESDRGFANHLLEAGTSEKVTLTIRFVVDSYFSEPMVANFGNIQFVYSNVAGSRDYDNTSYEPTSYECFSTSLNEDEQTVSIDKYNNDCGFDVIIPSNLPYTVFDYSQLEVSQDCESVMYTFLKEGLNYDSQEYANQVCTTLRTNPEDILADQSTIDLLTEIGVISFEISYSESTYPVTVIGDDAFSSSYLTSVVIPNTVTSIERYAFYYDNLTEVVIPNSVTSIGDDAFASNKLTSVTIPNSVTSIGSSAFSSNELTSISIPNSISTLPYSIFASNKLETIFIPDNITVIGNGAFYNNYLSELVLGDNVVTIGQDAFNRNKLTRVEIGSGIRSIQNYAFGSSTNNNGDKNLIRTFIIHIPSANKSLVSLGSCAINWNNLSCPSESTNKINITWD